MKRGTIDHPKTKRLARRLQLESWGAVGVLESLWHWTARYARLGDVGRYSDQDIADGIGWSRAAEELVVALVAERWIDEHPTSRLVIHDWAEHADETVKKTVRNRGESFFDSSHYGKLPESSGNYPNGSEPSVQHTALALALASGSGENPSSNKPRGGVTREVEARFVEFYAVYPRKIGKDNARRAYERRLKSTEDPDGMHREIMAGLSVQLPQLRLDAAREGGKFCPHPSTWLNAGRWQDAPPTNNNGDGNEPSPWDTLPRLVFCAACDKNHRVRPNPEACPVSGKVPEW